MPARKRARDEMEVEDTVEEPSMLHRLRSMWQFANLAQYLSLFGDAIKVDRDFDIEVRPACAQHHCECAQRIADGGMADKCTGDGGRVPQAPSI